MKKQYGSWVCLTGALLAGALMGCSSDAKSSATTPMGLTCTNKATPTPFTLTNVTPAVGASVPNQAIAQSFTLVGGGHISQLAVQYVATHTAGMPTPALAYTAIDDPAGDTQYAFQPVAWATAPGHVEIALGVNEVFQPSGSDTCYVLPNPVFSYDITAP